MQRFILPPVPDTLDELCEAYTDATGSYAWRLADRMLQAFPNAPLSAVAPHHAISFLRLRATILDALGDVSACRAIFKFAATQAAGAGDIVSQAAALAQLHVDRSFRLDDDTEHGSPFVGAIRQDLRDIVDLLLDNPTAMAQNPDLTTATLAHLVHGFALIGANADGRETLDQARVICPEKESLKARLDLADAVLLACSGQIDEALEFGELILGRDSEDPLALQVEVREFLGTWYRAIGRHVDAANHLRIVTDLCRDYDLPYMAVVAAMEQISSLVELNKPEIVVDLASWALDVAHDIGINNEVVRTLDIVLVQGLAGLGRHIQAVNCAEIAGTRAREHGDVDTAIVLYEMGAKSARISGDQARAANLYGFCAELTGGEISLQARFLRKESAAILATVGLKPPREKLPEEPCAVPPATDIPAAKLEAETLKHLEMAPDANSIEVRTALSLAKDLMDEALSLLMSTPEGERSLAAQELAKWNELRTWMAGVEDGTQPSVMSDESTLLSSDLPQEDDA